MHHLTCGISSLLHSVNLILFTVLIHPILRAAPYHSPTFAFTIYHSLGLLLKLKLISFTYPFLHRLTLSGSIWSWTAFAILDLDRTKWVSGHWRFVCFSFFFLHFCFRLRVLDFYLAHSAFQSTVNSCVVSYRMTYERLVSQTRNKLIKFIYLCNRINTHFDFFNPQTPAWYGMIWYGNMDGSPLFIF